MAVLIQQVVEADYAFVIHTVNPATGNPDELYSEVVLGLGETVVANYPGRALSFTWDKKSAKETLLAYPAKSVGLYGSGLIFRSDSNGEDLAGHAVAEATGSPQDIEGAWMRGDCYVVQTRPQVGIEHA